MSKSKNGSSSGTACKQLGSQPVKVRPWKACRPERHTTWSSISMILPDSRGMSWQLSIGCLVQPNQQAMRSLRLYTRSCSLKGPAGPWKGANWANVVPDLAFRAQALAVEEDEVWVLRLFDETSRRLSNTSMSRGISHVTTLTPCPTPGVDEIYGSAILEPELGPACPRMWYLRAWGSQRERQTEARV